MILDLSNLTMEDVIAVLDEAQANTEAAILDGEVEL